MSNTSPSLGDVQLPHQLAQRLEDEQHRFGAKSDLNADLSQHAERHDALLRERSEKAGEQVEHAKAVAAQHRDTSSASSSHDTTKELESTLESKRRSLERQQAELADVSARLAKADEVERQLRAKLGEAM
ncbi:hypothetical protein JCM8547_001096 [Rhodosporidiobolus lusitaniae]